MKRILDVGCGNEPDRFFPGAITAEANADIDEIDYANFVSLEEPLPIPDGSFDLIWYSFGWHLTDDNDKASIAAELSRVAAKRSTIIFRDYLVIQNWNTGSERRISLATWKKRLMKYFKPLGWNTPELYRGGRHDVLCILPRNWG